MKIGLFFSGALMLATLMGCATAPHATRTDFRPPSDAADGLKRYYDERLNPVEGGYRQKNDIYTNGELPGFYDVQGATRCAAWAREANTFAWVGTGTGLALFAAGIGLSAMAPPDDLGKNAWWISLFPAGLISWTFHWTGHGWFRQPSVALYNRRLAEKMGMNVLPTTDEP